MEATFATYRSGGAKPVWLNRKEMQERFGKSARERTIAAREEGRKKAAETRARKSKTKEN